MKLKIVNIKSSGNITKAPTALPVAKAPAKSAKVEAPKPKPVEKKPEKEPVAEPVKKPAPVEVERPSKSVSPSTKGDDSQGETKESKGWAKIQSEKAAAVPSTENWPTLGNFEWQIDKTILN